MRARPSRFSTSCRLVAAVAASVMLGGGCRKEAPTKADAGVGDASAPASSALPGDGSGARPTDVSTTHWTLTAGVTRCANPGQLRWVQQLHSRSVSADSASIFRVLARPGGGVASTGSIDIHGSERPSIPIVAFFQEDGSLAGEQSFPEADLAPFKGILQDDGGRLIAVGGELGQGRELTDAGAFAREPRYPSPVWLTRIQASGEKAEPGILLEKLGTMVPVARAWDRGRTAMVGFAPSKQPPAAHDAVESVIVLDDSGHALWTATVQGLVAVPEILFAEDGGLTVMGWSEVAGVRINGRAVPKLGRREPFLAWFGVDGRARVVELLRGDGQRLVQGGARRKGGGVVVVGTMNGTLALRGLPVLSARSAEGEVVLRVNAFVAAFDASGQPVWARVFPDESVHWPHDVAVDSRGDIVFVGEFQGSVDFGGGRLVSPDGPTPIPRSLRTDPIVPSTGFIAMLAPDGRHIWSAAVGDKGAQAVRSVSVDGAGDVVVGGEFEGTIGLGGVTIKSRGGKEGFVAKLCGPSRASAAGSPH